MAFEKRWKYVVTCVYAEPTPADSGIALINQYSKSEKFNTATELKNYVNTIMDSAIYSEQIDYIFKPIININVSREAHYIDTST